MWVRGPSTTLEELCYSISAPHRLCCKENLASRPLDSRFWSGLPFRLQGFLFQSFPLLRVLLFRALEFPPKRNPVLRRTLVEPNSGSSAPLRRRVGRHRKVSLLDSRCWQGFAFSLEVSLFQSFPLLRVLRLNIFLLEFLFGEFCGYRKESKTKTPSWGGGPLLSPIWALRSITTTRGQASEKFPF